MSKSVLANYSFNVATKQITLTDIATVRLDKLALITDITNGNKIIYNFADSSVSTATVSGSVVTLSTLPGGCGNSDKLRIDYDVEASDTTAFAAGATAVRQDSAASIAKETGGNLATVKTNTDPLVASGAGGYVRQDSTATMAKETGGNLATVKTNTDGLATSGGGGYVRQDSTGTIAKETGGNLATVKTNTDGLAASGGGGYVRQDSTGTIAKETGGNLATTATNTGTTATNTGTIAGAVSSSKMAVKLADGDDATLGAKTDNKSTATDTTSVSVVSLLKMISASTQAAATSVINKSYSQNGVVAASVVTSVTLQATELDGTAFTPVEVEITNLSGASALYVTLDNPSKSVTTTSTSLDTLTCNGHGLSTSVATPVAFTAVAFTSTPPLNTTPATVYFAKATDANNVKIYTDAAATALVDITSVNTATFYVAPYGSTASPYLSNTIAVLASTPSSITLPSVGVVPNVKLMSQGAPTWVVTLRGA